MSFPRDWIGPAVAVALLVLSIAFYFWLAGEREQDCRDRGGVELVSLRDNICVDADGRVLR